MTGVGVVVVGWGGETIGGMKGSEIGAAAAGWTGVDGVEAGADKADAVNAGSGRVAGFNNASRG